MAYHIKRQAKTEEEKDEDLPYNWQEGCLGIGHRAAILVQTQQWADCEFAVGETRERIQAHRLLLASASPVFAAMFYGPLAETKYPIVIPDVEPEVFKELLRSIATNEVHIPSIPFACELHYAAKKYLLPYLMELCGYCLLKHVEPRTACFLLEYATLVDEENLLRKCVQVIQQKTLEVLKSNTLEDASLGTLKIIFSIEPLAINSELELLKAAERYAKAQHKRTWHLPSQVIDITDDTQPVTKRTPVIRQKPDIWPEVSREPAPNESNMQTSQTLDPQPSTSRTSLETEANIVLKHEKSDDDSCSFDSESQSSTSQESPPKKRRRSDSTECENIIAAMITTFDGETQEKLKDVMDIIGRVAEEMEEKTVDNQKDTNKDDLQITDVQMKNSEEPQPSTSRDVVPQPSTSRVQEPQDLNSYNNTFIPKKKRALELARPKSDVEIKIPVSETLDPQPSTSRTSVIQQTTSVALEQPITSKALETQSSKCEAPSPKPSTSKALDLQMKTRTSDPKPSTSDPLESQPSTSKALDLQTKPSRAAPQVISLDSESDSESDNSEVVFTEVATNLIVKPPKEVRTPPWMGGKKQDSPIRPLLHLIRFLTITPQEFAECTTLHTLLSGGEIYSLMMNICSKYTPAPMPKGFSTSRVQRTQVQRCMSTLQISTVITEQDKSRTHMVQVITINSFSGLRSYHSAPFYLMNLPWRIVARPEYVAINGNYQVKYLSVFVECNWESAAAWHCRAHVHLKLMALQPNVPAHSLEFTATFSHERPIRGFSTFLAWDDVLSRGFLRHDTVTLMVTVSRANVTPSPLARRYHCFSSLHDFSAREQNINQFRSFSRSNEESNEALNLTASTYEGEGDSLNVFPGWV